MFSIDSPTIQDFDGRKILAWHTYLMDLREYARWSDLKGAREVFDEYIHDWQ